MLEPRKSFLVGTEICKVKPKQYKQFIYSRHDALSGSMIFMLKSPHKTTFLFSLTRLLKMFPVGDMHIVEVRLGGASKWQRLDCNPRDGAKDRQCLRSLDKNFSR